MYVYDGCKNISHDAHSEVTRS